LERPWPLHSVVTIRVKLYVCLRALWTWNKPANYSLAPQPRQNFKSPADSGELWFSSCVPAWFLVRAAAAVGVNKVGSCSWAWGSGAEQSGACSHGSGGGTAASSSFPSQSRAGGGLQLLEPVHKCGSPVSWQSMSLLSWRLGMVFLASHPLGRWPSFSERGAQAQRSHWMYSLG